MEKEKLRSGNMKALSGLSAGEQLVGGELQGRWRVFHQCQIKRTFEDNIGEERHTPGALARTPTPAKISPEL